MSNIFSWFKELFHQPEKLDPAPPAPSVPQPVAAPLTELQQDLLIFQSNDGKSELEIHNENEIFRARYSKQALADLLEHLNNQNSVSSKHDSLQQILDACNVINQKYPLKWTISLTSSHEEGTTTRYSLISHTIWLNLNGAYCITLSWPHTPIFSKPALDGTPFIMP
jgi:hypothetical protein